MRETPPPPPPGPAPAVPRLGGRFGPVLSVGAWALVVAVWGLTASGRALSAPPAGLAAAVLFLPYLYLGAAAAIFAAWTAAPDRRAPPLALGALLATAGWLWLPGRAVAREDPAARPVRVMSWNVQRLWGRKDAARCVADVLARERPDAVALLEVSARDVAGMAGLTCRHHPYTSREGSDRGGLATCVRDDSGWTLTRSDAARFVDDEDWWYELAEVVSGDHAFNVLVAHLYPYRGVARALVRGLSEGDPLQVLAAQDRSEAVSRGQSDQAAALLGRVAGLRDPTVVAGDFNSTPDAALHVALRAHLTDAWSAAGTGFGGTVSALGLPLRVDYVYASRSLGVRAAAVPAAGCSDHDPVVVDLQVPARAVSPAPTGR